MKTKKKKQRPVLETELACSLAGHLLQCQFRKICICRCHKGGNVSENEK